MGVLRTCDVCKTGAGVVKRYGIYRQERDPNDRLPDGRGRNKRSFGYGGIDLCDRCQEIICQPKSRKAGRTPRKPDPVERRYA